MHIEIMHFRKKFMITLALFVQKSVKKTKLMTNK